MAISAHIPMSTAAESNGGSASAETAAPSPVVILAAWHSVFWLMVSNAIGVGLAILLLWPGAGRWMGAWSYGRWMPVHLNLQLYGWVSLPLVAWLIRIYSADRAPVARWSRIALLLWSLALALGSVSWLNGHSSGKLFLDWSGYTRVLFPLSIAFLWCVLTAGLLLSWTSERSSRTRIFKLAGLALLMLIPVAIYAAANPAIYPAVNPDSGGPTGASQLESVLIIVLILFILPFGITRRSSAGRRWIVTGWILLALETLLCLGIGHGDVSHHRPTQFISLGSLLLWVPLVPAYYSAFRWRPETRQWRIAVLVWWAVLVPTGWCLFLPGILDRLKFTDGLVGHSLLAMAGFVTSLLILLLMELLEAEGSALNARWAFVAWQAGTAVYIAIMFVAGWTEGGNPSFTIVPNTAREVIYSIRLACGIAMTAASADWLYWLTKSLRATREPATTMGAL
jgi:cytochrome c oxidase cbb3-type subunit 1